MLKFGSGFVAGFAALFILIMIFGDYEEEPATVVAQSISAPAQAAPAAIAQTSGPTYAAICDADTSNMTDPQIAQHAQQWVGQRFSGWQGWIYDVVARADGTYNLEIAMEERGLFWTRDVVIENIVSDLALRLNVEQRVTLSGRVASVDTTFEVMCNPLYVDDYVLVE